MNSFDIQLFVISKLDVVKTIMFSRLNKQFYKVLSIHSKDYRLSKKGLILRFFLRHLDKVNPYGLSYNTSIPIEF
jgi:hypothetical protein